MTGSTWQEVLSHLAAGEDLESTAADWAMREIITGQATEAQLSAFAVLLRAKGETLTELRSIADRMYLESTPLDLDLRTFVDIVGTGGDGSHSVNISTMAALVTAAAGVPVVKHGNRAASSKCGSADLLEALGIELEGDARSVRAAAEELDIAFCFARSFHPGMRHAGPARAAIKIPTVFNLLGPLTNPARPPAGLIGCADESKAPLMAGVFAERKATAVVARGQDGLDEVSTGAPTDIWLTTAQGEVVTAVIDSREFGIDRSAPGALRGGDAEFNARVARSLFSGERGPVRDAVLLNAAVAIAAAASHDSGADLSDDSVRHEAVSVGLQRAAGAVDSGSAADLVDRWAAFTGA
ncbi:anthranilate phosphoribosyltransferase [Salininema proteolyticum]|uniref:Anthranilate phosphoribosyltransferase n=1 Tax=Salininema proteolyticum TaxID=1607685 RepID=A0ABV8TZ07_9ACTN